VYRVATIEDKIRVPPEKLGTDVKKAIRAAIADQLEGTINQRLGVILSVLSIERIGEGRILPNDAGVYYNCEFQLLTFKPEMHEIVEGEVIDNTEFGSFVRIGPMDGLVHISQLMDDFVSFDNKNSVFLGKDSKRTLKEGDLVRARIISASFGVGDNKIGLTMRQSGLGAISWIEDVKKRSKVGGAKPSKSDKADKAAKAAKSKESDRPSKAEKMAKPAKE
jgi:DNA-directed RNA polymerase subunit E'